MANEPWRTDEVKQRSWEHARAVEVYTLTPLDHPDRIARAQVIDTTREALMAAVAEAAGPRPAAGAGGEPSGWPWPSEWPEAVRDAADVLYRCRFPRSGARIAAIGALVDALRASLAGPAPSGGVCPTHGKAVLVTHVDDGEPCSDYLLAGVRSPAGGPTAGEPGGREP